MPENHLPSKADIERVRQAIEGVPDQWGKRHGGLNQKIDGIDERFDKQDRVIRNNRILTGLVILLLIAVTGGAAYFLNLLHDQAVAQCESSNERLGVQRDLWTGILTATPPKNEQEANAVGALVRYANKGFGDRNCADLSEEFEAPEFPELGLDHKARK